MKPLALIGWCLLLAACSSTQKEPGGEQLPTADRLPGYEARKSLDIAVDTPTGVRLVGLGVELDPHFFAQNLTRSDGAQASDWDRIIAPRIRRMRIERMRVMLLPHWWEPRNDNSNAAVADPRGFTFDSREMQSLYKVLDLAEETGADVTLVLWGCATACRLLDPAYADVGRHFLCGEGSNWVVEPADADEFAESFSVVTKHLIEQRGYTCIRELTPFNEPDGGVIPLERYIPLVEKLDTRLRRDGIRDRVKLNLSDNTDTRRFFLEGCAERLADAADLFNSHTYIFGYDTPNSEVVAWEKANVAVARRAGKEHFVGEFGSNQCVGATRQRDIDRYERGVLMTRHVINFLNAGAVGASYWSLIDQYYFRTDPYNAMQQLGMWRYVQAAYANDPDPAVAARERIDYEVRPQYYAYSLLTRFVNRGDEVYPLDLGNELAAGTALRDAEGRWTYVVANGSDGNLDFDLKNPHAGGTDPCAVYRYLPGHLPEGDAVIEPEWKLTTVDGVFRLSVPRQSVLLLTQR